MVGWWEEEEEVVECVGCAEDDDAGGDAYATGGPCWAWTEPAVRARRASTEEIVGRILLFLDDEKIQMDSLILWRTMLSLISVFTKRKGS